MEIGQIMKDGQRVKRTRLQVSDFVPILNQNTVEMIVLEVTVLKKNALNQVSSKYQLRILNQILNST